MPRRHGPARPRQRNLTREGDSDDRRPLPPLRAPKEGFIAHFRKQAEADGTRLNPWADWHDFHVLGDSAVCVLTRRHSGMSGEEMQLLCNIEWRFEDGRWQVLREQIFLRPLDA